MNKTVSKENVDPITALTCEICGKQKAVDEVVMPTHAFPTWDVKPVCAKCKAKIGEAKIAKWKSEFDKAPRLTDLPGVKDLLKAAKPK